MAWTTKQMLLAFLMLVTGSINTLSTKWADLLTAVGVDEGVARNFVHPFLQSVGMFAGELSCLVAFKILVFYYQRKGQPMEIGPQTFSPFIFLPASLCDMCGTSIMYVGLNLTFASSFQMLRGAVMIFTALLSVIFLRRVIRNHMWLGMFIVLIGLVAVGISDMVFSDENKSDINGIISGDLLIIMAQIIVAVQMVYEEKFITRHDVPALQAVGWEGFFGFILMGLLLVPFYFIKVGKPFSQDPEGRLENALDAFAQMGNNHLIIIAFLGNIISIAFFNFAGISVTKELSATTRMVLDSLRTLVIWAFSLAVGWQPWHYQEFFVQCAGFFLLLVGMCIYNEIVFAPFLRKHNCLKQDEDDLTPIISSDYPAIQDDYDETSPLVPGSGPNIPAYSSSNAALV